MAKNTFATDLRKIFPREAICDQLEDRICYSYDATGERHLPDIVLFPRSVEDVSRVLKLANQYRIPVIPRGAGTGYSGGSLAVKGGIILALSQMNQILEIDVENLTALVEPGVVTGVFQNEVESRGLFYPPDPASLESSTLGGNVAECAGGPRCLKYGVTKDYVLGLEVVLPTGEIIETGGRVLKDVVGYDLTRLMIGSEGTLGVITKIRLKLRPLPPAQLTLLAVFGSVAAATQAVRKIISARILPAALEFMDEYSIKAVNDYLPGILPEEAKSLLLIELDGLETAIKYEAVEIERVIGSPELLNLEKAEDKNSRDLLWKARRAVSPSLKKYKLKKLNQDVVVPRSQLTALIEGVHRVAEKYGLFIINFGHAGDGNIHINIMLDPIDEETDKKGRAAVKEIFQLVINLGGCISGEHGVGLSKAPYIKLQLTSEALGAMWRIKNALDPQNILNPGKIFPPVGTD